MKINSAEFAAAVVEVVRSADAVDRVCLGSFGRRVAARGPRARADPGHQRRARGGAVGPLSELAAAGRSAALRTPAIRFPSALKPRESCRRLHPILTCRGARRSSLDRGHRGRCATPWLGREAITSSRCALDAALDHFTAPGPSARLTICLGSRLARRRTAALLQLELNGHRHHDWNRLAVQPGRCELPALHRVQRGLVERGMTTKDARRGHRS